MKYVVSKFNDDGSIYPVYECEDEEEAMKTAYACNGVYEKVSPSLTDDQQVVLEWMKEAYKRTKWSSPFGTVCSTMNIHELFVLMRLTKAQQFQVLATFAEWGKKEEE